MTDVAEHFNVILNNVIAINRAERRIAKELPKLCCACCKKSSRIGVP